jgi:hypothetical protein
MMSPPPTGCGRQASRAPLVLGLAVLLVRRRRR